MSRRVATTALLLAGLTCHASHGQTPRETFALRQDLRNDSYVWEPLLKRSIAPRGRRPTLVNPGGQSAAAPPLDATARSVMAYYGARRRAAAMAWQPPPQAPSAVTQAQYQEAPAQPAPAAGAPAEDRRPFRHATTRPTVTAYLNLYREGFEEATPSYYTFVRPQLEREEKLRRQQMTLDRMSRRRGRSLAPAPAARTAGGAARFGDTGHYYRGPRR